MFYGSDNFSVGVGLSIASPSHHPSRYMADQTFHTPNFGDEEFEIPPIALHPSNDSHGQGNMSYSMGMGHGGADQQGQHYSSMYLPDHMTTPMTIHSPVSYGGSPPTYTTLSSPHAPSQPQMGNTHMMHHPQGTRPQQQQSLMGTNAPPGRSPTNSNSPANPETTTSDDSDDSVPVSQLTPALKRPSPEPVDTRSMPAAAVPVKKPKAQKKKKKRDPNEPQKPVSAYALFFRDTQAAIKGQNPNASFGEVSKIVASMWDALDAEHKNVYKKKTEAAKKEYLKALAAYRASLVSKGAPTDSADGSGMYPPSFNANISSQQHYSTHSQSQNYYGNQGGQSSHPSQPTSQQKKSPQQQQQQVVQQSQQPPPQSSMPPPQTPQQASQQQQQSHPMMQQMTNSHIVDNQYGAMRHSAGYLNPMGDGSHGMGMTGGMHMGSGGHGQMPGPVMSHMNADNHNHSQRQMCVRNGCNNIAMASPEWDDEYCSSECVVTHCRDVFTNWVTHNQGGNTNYGSSVKFNGPGNSGVVGADGLSYVT